MVKHETCRNKTKGNGDHLSEIIKAFGELYLRFYP